MSYVKLDQVLYDAPVREVHVNPARVNYVAPGVTNDAPGTAWVCFGGEDGIEVIGSAIEIAERLELGWFVS